MRLISVSAFARTSSLRWLIFNSSSSMSIAGLSTSSNVDEVSKTQSSSAGLWSSAFVSGKKMSARVQAIRASHSG